MKKTLILTILISLLYSCDPIDEASENCHKFITVKNNTSVEIYFVQTGNQNLNSALSCRTIPIKIEPNSEVEIEEFWDCWEEQIDKTYQGALILKFLENNDYFLECEDFNGTIPNELFILTKEITTNDLRANDWKINYP